jgi:hypothetical protein
MKSTRFLVGLLVGIKDNRPTHTRKLNQDVGEFVLCGLTGG